MYMDKMLISKIISTLIFFLILYGIHIRHEKKLHSRIMLGAFVFDLLLVLFIEINNQAIDRSLGFPGGLLGFHIIISVLTIIFYIWMIFTGLRLYSETGSRPLHRQLALIFLGLRFTNLITSFFV
jgi:uncharacterized membrane protein YozB (DUF420 family)